MGPPLWKAVWWFFKELKVDLPHDPTIPVLGIHLKELSAESHRNMCLPVFTAILFTIAKIWK